MKAVLVDVSVHCAFNDMHEVAQEVVLSSELVW